MTRSRLSDGELAALAARIQRNYDYEARSGLLFNLKTQRLVRGYKGASRNGEYHYLYFNCIVSGKRYIIQMHKAVWAGHNGRFPTLQIDHINGIGFDNRIENLREVTPSENQLNQRRTWKPNAKTGLPGVNEHGNGYRIKVALHRYSFRDKYEAFYHLTLLGRRYK